MASTGVSRISGIDPFTAFKAPCKVATTANITLSGAQTIDDVSVVEGDRVFVRSQSDASENGIYIAKDTAWVRADDFNGARDVVQGTQVKVNQGSTYKDFIFFVSTPNPITIGTTELAFGVLYSVGSLSGNPSTNHFSIGCIPRSTSGTFALLDDANHTPMNVASVSTPDVTTVRVNYSYTASKINSFIAAPDDALAPHGVVLGGDVGTSFANIKGFAPLTGRLSRDANGAYFTTTAIWDNEVGNNILVSKVGDSTVQLIHPISVSGAEPAVTPIYNSFLKSTARPQISASTAGQVNITMYDNASGYVNYDGADWQQTLSNNVNDPSLTWQAGSSSIRVDHSFAGIANSLPLVSRVATVSTLGYHPVLSNTGGEWFEVQFYDDSGTLITTEDTEMKFFYWHKILVESIWDDGVVVAFLRGPCVLTPDCYDGVAGNNIWVMGDMEF